MGSSALLAIPVMYGGWAFGVYASRHRETSKMLIFLGRLWDGTRFAIILGLSLGSAAWLQSMVPSAPSLSIAVVLIGCTVAGYDFDRANPRHLV
jgi:hypothetical protein